MTTTLRPTGPEQRGPHGARAREFTVCVNSRPVGLIRLATHDRLGPSVGRITSLTIEPPDRRRGRGTVAALAAEEVLRGWGCRQVEANVPADAEVALRLAAVLGYTERDRRMLKRLPATASPLPPEAVVRPMDERGYAVWRQRERAVRIGCWEARGLPPEQAAACADADCARALPDGLDTADTALRVLCGDGADIGWLWVRLRDRAAPGAPGWVFSIEVAEDRRGTGHGRTLMLAAERECLAAGVGRLGLDVCAGNAPALRLCTSLGYRATHHTLSKPLL